MHRLFFTFAAVLGFLSVALGAFGAHGLKAHLAAEGIPSVIYYVKPLHLQKAYERFPRTPGGLPVSEALPRQILCLPMHPYLSIADQDRVIKAIRTFLEGQAGATAAAE